MWNNCPTVPLNLTGLTNKKSRCRQRIITITVNSPKSPCKRVLCIVRPVKEECVRVWRERRARRAFDE